MIRAVEVFECCINGQEISPGYTEQNDPIAQRATLEHQAGGEQQKLDENFLVALEHGMPPAGGIGIGIDRLCMMLLGQEISPGYTEQNDPIQQRATLEHQAGGEQQKLDEDFLVALEHGMPPAGGIGIGIDRLCIMLLGQESIRDVILFPQLKPK